MIALLDHERQPGVHRPRQDGARKEGGDKDYRQDRPGASDRSSRSWHAALAARSLARGRITRTAGDRGAEIGSG